VAQVYSETPAASAGIQVDDLILNFNGIEIEDENHLIHLVSLTELNRPVRVVVLRNGKQLPLNITLMDRDQVKGEETKRPIRRQSSGGGASFRSSGLTKRRMELGVAAQLGYRQAPQGLLVMDVPPSEDADRLQLYDVVEAVARTPVTTPAEFDAALGSQPEGAVVLRVRRMIDGSQTVRLVILER
jgi:serine protease Do